MIHILYAPGSGGLFDRVRWSCSGAGAGCRVWYASAWNWAPAMAAEHVARCHPAAQVTGLAGRPGRPDYIPWPVWGVRHAPR